MISYMRELCWNMREFIESRYLERKYAEMPLKIYYDRKYRCYINPKLLNEQGDIEYICSEITRSGCLYRYRLDGKKEHTHTIAEVFLSAYNEAERFSIDTEDEELYSKQELVFIQTLVEQGKLDRQTK